MTRQAVILVGGLGKRLGELTCETPKPMIDVGGVPFLEYVVRFLKRQGVDDLLLAVSYLNHVIQDYCGDGGRFGVRIHYIFEEEPAGTGGFLKIGKELLAESFFVLNGDTLFDVDCRRMAGLLDQETDLEGVVAARRVDDTSRYGALRLADSRVAAFDEKDRSGAGQINGGVYLLRKSVCRLADRPPVSMEKDVLPELVNHRSLGAVVFDGFFIDMGIPESLAEARRLVPEWDRRISILSQRRNS